MRYEIKGKVIDQETKAGVAGVRVEAWGTGLDIEDDLGYTATLYDGSFAIPFDEETYRDLFRDRYPDIYLDVYCGDELLASTEEYTHWRMEAPDAYVTIEVSPLKPMAWRERHVYLKIERFSYNPVKPVEEEAGLATYGRDCMRNKGHENGFIPQPEIDARALDAIVYREYLDSAYLIPKPDRLIRADINEPLYEERVPGPVIYARPYERLTIHVWNTDDVPHSLHAHGLRYGIDSDGTWPFGTQAAGNGRSDAICPGATWCYIFDLTYDTIGAWPFHDYTHYSNISIEQGLFGGIVVLSYCDKAPAPFRFDEGMLGGIYADLQKTEGRNFLPEDTVINFSEDPTPFIFAPQIHFKRLKPQTQQLLEHHLDFLEEFVSRAYSLPCAHIPTDHVPVFFHRMSRKPTPPPPPPPPRPLDLNLAIDRQLQLRDLAVALGPRQFDLAVNPVVNPLVPDRRRAAIPSLCINGRSFVGNTPTIVGRSGQRIRWYVFNLDISTNGHNFHPHGMRWKFAGEYIDTRSFGPGESFVVEATIPPVVLLTEEEAQIQQPQYRPKEAQLYCVKGDFLFHCHEQDHLLNGMAGLVRSRQSFWLTPEMADAINRRTGLPLDDGRNTCPDVEADPCGVDRIGHWEEVPGAPDVLLMHSILLPNTKQVLFWGQTRPDQARIWDYSTPAGSFISPTNQTANLTPNSDLWSAAHNLLDTPEGTLLVHGGFTGGGAFTFDPTTRTYAQVGSTVGNRFYATTIVIGDGRAVTLFGNVKTIEVFTLGVGWAAPIDLAPFGMSHHQYYPWTYLLPDGKLFIAGPHDPSQRFDFNAPAGVESFATGKGDRTTPGEKGTSVLLILRPPDYKPIAYIMGGQFPAVEKSAQQIDLSVVPTPAWVDLPDLKNARNKQFTATLLPDGRVFIAGGIEGGADGGPCEIFDPRNPGAGWVEGPNIKFVRSYHSSFLLLQDGSILGGGAPPNVAFPPFTPHERFFPGYFDKLRPVITGAPATINYGGNFTINTPTPPDISEVVLLRAGATTHGFNMGQRGLELVIAGIGAGTLNVETPPNANLAPPGWYLLFILDSDRVPSEGRWIRVTS